MSVVTWKAARGGQERLPASRFGVKIGSVSGLNSTQGPRMGLKDFLKKGLAGRVQPVFESEEELLLPSACKNGDHAYRPGIQIYGCCDYFVTASSLKRKKKRLPSCFIFPVEGLARPPAGGQVLKREGRSQAACPLGALVGPSIPWAP